MDMEHRTGAVEEWKAVEGYEGIYEVSNLGNVRSLDRWERSRGSSMKPRKGRMLAKSEVVGGYLRCMLWKDCKQKFKSVHRMVAAAFIGPCPEGKEVNHIDGNKKNNCVANLEYVTKTENIRHAVGLGLNNPVRGEDHQDAKLTDEAVREVRRLRGVVPLSELAERFGVCKQVISQAQIGATWRHVDEPVREIQKKGPSKLTKDEAIAIYEAKGKEHWRALSERYGVRYFQIRKIWRGECWGDVTGARPA